MSAGTTRARRPRGAARPGLPAARARAARAVPTARRGRRDRARARPRRRNIVDMALSPSTTTPGRVALWSRREHARARRADRRLGFPVRSGADEPSRFEPTRPAERRADARRRTSRSPTARRCSARWPPSPVRIENYLHAADTTSTLDAVRALGALRRGCAPARSSCAARACARRASRAGRSTWATRARCCACCPAGSPRRRAARSRSTATSRSAAARSTASPSRCALMGADAGGAPAGASRR